MSWGTLSEEGLIEVDFQRTLAMLDQESMSDAEVKEALTEAKVDVADPRMPSVETPLHAICLQYEGVSFVGHSHPTAVNAITCSNRFEEELSKPIFPDEVVVCGTEPLLVPYVDPGVKLAKVVKERLDDFVGRVGHPPKTIYMQNHGLIALGDSAKQVKSITAMAVKAARIRIGTQSFGGSHPMSADNVDRIDSRPDEHYRQAIIKTDQN